MSRETRADIIQEIEKNRGSKLIIYVTSDRHGLSFPMAADVVSLIHEHILSLKE